MGRKKASEKLRMRNEDFWKHKGRYGKTFINQSNAVIKKHHGEFHGDLVGYMENSKRKGG